MLDVLIQFSRLSTFKEMSTSEIVDFFDTELVEAIKYLYGNHKLNYDKLYQQEKLHSVEKIGSKGTNYEQHMINALKSKYNWDEILKYAIESDRLQLGNYNKLIRLSNNLKATNKKLNKLEKKFVQEKYKNTNIDTKLILDSYYNYYSGSIFDLMLDPIWSLVGCINVDLYVNDPEFTEVLFDRNYVISFSKMLSYVKKFNMVAYDMFYIVYKHMDSKYNIFTAMKKVLSDRYKFTSAEIDEMMYIVNEICLWGKLNGIFKDADKELIGIQNSLDLYRTSGIKFMFEI